MSEIVKENWWEESRSFKKTKVEEYLNIDETLVELEKTSSVIRLEMNSIELPLFSKDPKRVKNEIKVYHFKTDKSSYLEIEAPAGSSIPGEFEERVFIALTKIMKKNGYKKNIKACIFYQSYNIQLYEKDLFFDLLTKCLEKEKIEKQRDVVCRSWAREIFKRTGRVSAHKKIQLKKMENEFEYNQKVTFKSVTPKSRINNLLLIDELKNFPDSYSLISNLNFDNFNSKELKDNLILIVNIFEKNKELLEGILLDVNKFKILFKGKPLYYPEWETENIISYYEKINVVLWCYSNSKFFKHNY